jgi:GDP-4-dehydro-6-deoxy-D-mannose reductase
MREPEIRVGDLDVRRDFVDVRDAARAYWLAATRGEAGEAYNVAGGRARSIREVLTGLLALARVSPPVVGDPARMRPAELRVLEGDPARFRAATGWRPAIPFEQTLADTLSYWREAVGA